MRARSFGLYGRKKNIMDKKQKQRLEELKQNARIYGQEQQQQNNVLLQECLATLSSYTIVSNAEIVNGILRLLSLPNIEMHSHDEYEIFEDVNQYYIVWDEATLPVIMTSGKNIRENWEDVMAVSFDTYFVDVLSKKTIGIRH